MLVLVVSGYSSGSRGPATCTSSHCHHPKIFSRFSPRLDNATPDAPTFTQPSCVHTRFSGCTRGPWQSRSAASPRNTAVFLAAATKCVGRHSHGYELVLILHPVTTRTTSLTSVSHHSFALRFSNVLDIEDAVHEDEEQRAGRTMDWIGSRISQRCERWMDMLETESREGGKMWRTRTPWWEEVKRCVDGDHVPSSVEGWNHPVSRAYN